MHEATGRDPAKGARLAFTRDVRGGMGEKAIFAEKRLAHGCC